MKQYKNVDEFLADLDDKKREQTAYLRKIILRVAPNLTENIKWNAPNYSCFGVDRITFNVHNKQGIVKLILHMGASKPEDKIAAPVMPGFEDILSWNSNIRGTVSFTDLADIKAKEPRLSDTLRQWLRQD